MPANFVASDDVNGIFSQVMEHQEANIIDIWTKAESKINPVLACFEARSEDDGGGRGFITRVGISTGTSANPSYTLAAAKAAGATTGNSAVTGRWVSQSKQLEIVAAWTRRAVNAARGDGPGEVYDVIARERESKIVLARHRLAVFAIERGYGRVATIVSISDGNLYFTVDPSEVNRFRKGDDICFSQYETSGALLKSATGDGKWTVSGTDPATGTVYVEANAAYQPYDDGARNGYMVFWFGYREDDSTPEILCPQGLRAWVPQAVPTATSFEGIDTRYNWELNGHRVDATGLDHAGAFLEMASRAQQYGSEIHAIYCSPADFKVLCRNKDAVKTLSQYQAGKYMVGFSGVEVLGGVGGSIPVIPDAYIPQGTAWGGPWNDADFGPKLKHVRNLINVDNLDGNEFLRLASSTGYEQRMYFDGAMIMPAPGKYICAINLPTT
jgi:hypothetical protein